MIRIVNLRNYKPVKGEVLIKVDRSSVLGNPYFMKDESMRNEVCDKYARYFKEAMDKEEFRLALIEIYRLSKNNNIALGCWCYPKRCHAETIKDFIESFE